MTQKELFKKIRSSVQVSQFAKTPFQLLWLPCFLGLILFAKWLLQFDLIVLKIVASVVIGYVFAAMAFLFHDLRHGGIIASSAATNVISQLLIWPCLTSSHFWDFWHNQLHHKYHLIENRLLKEYPTDSFLKKTIFSRLIKKISPPESGLAGFSYLFFWYVPYVVLIELLLCFQTKRFRDLNRSVVIAEVLGAAVMWWLWLSWFNFQNLLYVVLIPLCVLSYLLSSYVVTNHHPELVKLATDKTINTCSVTVPKVIDFLHFNFSYHTEHHLFPEVSSWHLPKVKDQIQQHFPSHYIAVDKNEALGRIYFKS